MRAFTRSELTGILDAVLRIENPKAWLQQQSGHSKTVISKRRKPPKRRDSRRK